MSRTLNKMRGFLTHLESSMIDVSAKNKTNRTAIAYCALKMNEKSFKAINQNIDLYNIDSK